LKCRELAISGGISSLPAAISLRCRRQRTIAVWFCRRRLYSALNGINGINGVNGTGAIDKKQEAIDGKAEKAHVGAN